jgi:hypothetical protein
VSKAELKGTLSRPVKLAAALIKSGDRKPGARIEGFGEPESIIDGWHDVVLENGAAGLITNRARVNAPSGH